MKRNRMLINKAGFTLLELLVVMAIFMVVMGIAVSSFNNILGIASKYTKSEESNIEGIIGLEVLRHDIEQMGFGLFWGTLNPVTYAESTDASSATNDSPSSAPRAFVGFDEFGPFAADYLAIKATTVGRTRASQRWTYATYENFESGGTYESRPIIWPSDNLKAGDQAIAVRSNFNDPNDDRLLLLGTPSKPGSFYFSFSATGGINDNFLPAKDQQISMIYGLEESEPRMPFNRSDFFIKVPDGTTGGILPPFCAPHTGVLYKATVNNSTGTGAGKYTYLPLVDCIADMQVILGWDASEGGKANSVTGYSTAPKFSGGSVTTSDVSASDVQEWLTNAKDIREHLKMVKVYLLVQEGRIDRKYTYPSATITVGPSATDGGFGLGHTYSFTTDQRNYRWKLYRLIVRPKNMMGNQR